MRKFNHLIGKVEENVGAAMLFFIVILVFISAITRMRIIGKPIIWSVDLAQLLFVWICMLGADVALKKGAHMGVDMLVRKFPVFLQKGLALFSCFLCSAFIVFIIYWGTILCIQNYLRKYQTLKISYSFSTAAIPVVSVFMFFTMLEMIFDIIRNWNNEKVIIRLEPEEAS